MPVVIGSSSGSELPVTVSDEIAATHDLLQGTYRSEWNTLAVAMQPTDTTITLTGPLQGAVTTSYLAVDDEILYVQAGNQSAQTCQVLRGFDGTTPAAHAVGALVEVNPRFPRHQIRRQLALEIASWPNNLFQIKSTTFTISNDGFTFAYDLGIPTQDILYLLDVRHAPWNATLRNTWPPFTIPPKLNRNVDTSTFPSGVALELPAVETSGIATCTGAVECRVVYGGPFNLSSMDDPVLLGPGGIGLAQSMLDIPALGAAARLIGPREAMRTFGEAMDQARPTQDVPAGAAMKIAAFLQASRDQRIAEEIEHLNVAWPLRAK